MFKCPKCNYSVGNLNSLRIHAAKQHNLLSEDLYLSIFVGGIKPTCRCGCGEYTKFNSLQKGYSEYNQGHSARVNNNWGHNKAAFEKSLQTRRKMWENGEIKGWCDGLTKEDPRIAAIIEKMNTPERAQKISKSLSGKSKSTEHRKKISENMSAYWSREENRSRQSFRQAECIRNGMLTKATRVHGYYENPKKTHGPVYYRSLFELNAVHHLEQDDNVVSYVFEPFRIEYEHDGKVRHYIADCLVEYCDGRRVIVEFKPNCHIGDAKNQAKFGAASLYASGKGMTFEVWSEKTHPFLSLSVP